MDGQTEKPRALKFVDKALAKSAARTLMYNLMYLPNNPCMDGVVLGVNVGIYSIHGVLGTALSYFCLDFVYPSSIMQYRINSH